MIINQSLLLEIINLIKREYRNTNERFAVEQFVIERLGIQSVEVTDSMIKELWKKLKLLVDENGYISHSKVSQKICNLAAFKHYQISASTLMKAAIQKLIDERQLELVSEDVVFEIYSGRSKYYRILGDQQ